MEGHRLECLDQGAHVIATDDLYGGTLRLFERVRQPSAGLLLIRVDRSDAAAIEAAIRPRTRLIWVEHADDLIADLDQSPAELR
jgi:cystathionine gamma-lyase